MVTTTLMVFHSHPGLTVSIFSRKSCFFEMEEKFIKKCGIFDNLLNENWGKLFIEMENECKNKHNSSFNKTL